MRRLQKWAAERAASAEQAVEDETHDAATSLSAPSTPSAERAAAATIAEQTAEDEAQDAASPATAPAAPIILPSEKKPVRVWKGASLVLATLCVPSQ